MCDFDDIKMHGATIKIKNYVYVCMYFNTLAMTTQGSKLVAMYSSEM